MHTLNQMDPNLYVEVLLKQKEVWSELMAALEETWQRSVSPDWTVEVSISEQEVLADLSHGRD